MSRAGRATRWAGANIVPLVLIPLAALLIWVAVWRVWLPPVGGTGPVTRTVTTIDSNAATKPTHKVTTVVRSSRAAAPSRRSELLALALVFLGSGAAVIAVFHNRIGSIELDKDGVKIELDAAERGGAAELVGRLAAAGAGPRTYGSGLDRYLRALAARRSPGVDGAGAAAEPDRAAALADRIADELVS